MYRYAPDHPHATKAGYVLESVVVWEEAHGRKLPDGWIIHHLNGLKKDNRPENLKALPRRSHGPWLHLHALYQRIRELESQLAQSARPKPSTGSE